jgi:hypothetical protein
MAETYSSAAVTMGHNALTQRMRPSPFSPEDCSRSLTDRTRSEATSMTSTFCRAWPEAFLALTASPSMTLQ